MLHILSPPDQQKSGSAPINQCTALFLLTINSAVRIDISETSIHEIKHVDHLSGSTNETKVRSQRNIHRTASRISNPSNQCIAAQQRRNWEGGCISIQSPFLGGEQGKCAVRAQHHKCTFKVTSVTSLFIEMSADLMKSVP